jgi:hypothetical protein
LELSSFASLDEKIGEATVNVIAIKASVHLPFDHSLLVQNLTAQVSQDILEFDGMVCVYIVSKVAPYCFNIRAMLHMLY